MILAILMFTARIARRRWAGVCILLILAGTGTTRAQSDEGGYLPSGGGTFVPFRGGGVGVMPSGPRGPAGASISPLRPMSVMPGSATLGLRDGLAPLRPIGVGGGMGPSPLLSRPAAMKAMPRPPVGSYPFRIPPSLRGGPAQRPAMAM